jgi:hypothetical protein
VPSLVVGDDALPDDLSCQLPKHLADHVGFTEAYW